MHISPYKKINIDYFDLTYIQKMLQNVLIYPEEYF